MWNIRMRASRKNAFAIGQGAKGKGKGKKTERLLTLDSCRLSSFRADEVHISGAEGIYPEKLVRAVVQEYIDRARDHPKGRPDRIAVTIEKLHETPKKISALPVITLKCSSPVYAQSHIRRLLATAGISSRALDTAFSIVQGGTTMRGAALVHVLSGRRLEPDISRGIRASRLGITPAAEKKLSRVLQRCGIDTQTVREALVLASKVSAHRDIVAELCISDDPDYTTGYVASSDRGYVRVPHIKKRNSTAGGRVFFLKDAVDVLSVVRYLERTPVLVASVRPCSGKASVHEIIDHHYR